ncbi:MAG TPA: LPS assembly lipoprotein LptE [Candidatus Competibacteraceae bacterium]|nr:LPS assembly lipoprotein LptE [Candidatus Competibacteraceae bacterium]
MISRRRLLSRALALGGAGLLAGCGFQLRGRAELPRVMAVTHIDARRPPGAGPTPLQIALTRRLRANGITVSDSPQGAGAIIRLLREDNRKRTLATSKEGAIREDELTYIVEYQVERSDGTPLVPRDTLEASRNLLYEETKVLGRVASEDLLVRDMVNDLASSILRRLQAVQG